MKKVYTSSLVVMLLLGFLFHVQSVAAIMYPPEDIVMDHPFEKRYFALQDAILGDKEYCGYTEEPDYPPLEIVKSDAPDSEYMAVSPYYKVFFKGTTVKMVVQDAWIAFSLMEQDLGKVNTAALMAEKNSVSVLNVFDSVDLSYEVDTSLLTEVLTLQESKEFNRIIQEVSWEGMNPVYEEDGSILFLNEEKELLKILPPFMKDAKGAVCEDIHYELIETETGYELHKVIDEKGLKWLEQAVYPVTIDPSMQTFEDAWESSGLTPSGQYFKNLKEYVNPATGHLTVTQTDLTIPGRGLDLVLSRVYQTPAVFYGLNPYDYEAPPVDVGKGWQLDFPYVGDNYLHLWGGTVYKIVWSGNTFENHKGSHFTLVKNGDSTYTLTMANGTVFEFSVNGYLTHMKDLDENSIYFSYTGEDLTSITDTIGRTVSLSYSSGRLWKIMYNNEEIEFSYDGNGCLQWMEDFLNRRTSYFYDTGYNNWLLSKIEYPTTGYATYHYSRFSDNDYYKYHVTNQRVYETEQVRHATCSYTGSFSEITASETTIKNESDITQGFHSFTINDSIITEKTTKNASGTPLSKYVYTYNSKNEVTKVDVYNDGSHFSYTTYFSYDNWGNIIYAKNAEGHKQFFSYANTNTSGYFIDNTGTIIKQFTNAFSNCTVPSSVHTAVIGVAEKQDNTYAKEAYFTYDSKAHVTDTKTVFGETTTWVTYSGTFNEYTGDTSFFIDLTDHTVAGNGVLQITGLPSDQIWEESHSFNCASCPYTCSAGCNPVSGSWSGKYYSLNYQCCIEGLYGRTHCPTSHTASIGPFTHYPGTLGYQGYFTDPGMGEYFTEFTVTTRWKTYPAKVDYNLDNSAWKTITTNLKDGTAYKTAPLSDGVHTLYFNESSSYDNKFSWTLWVPVDSTPDIYTTAMTYDVYGNVTSVTDAQSNAINFTYSSDYSHAYLTEISAVSGTDTITTRASYDYDWGWITSTQEPKGVAGSGYDTLYTYDVLGRIIKKEFPLLDGQSERSYIQAVYDCENRTVTIINVLGHYITKEFDKLGRLTATKLYTGQFGQGTLYATESYTYYYNNKIKTVTDPGNDIRTYTYDFLGRNTLITFSDSSTVSYSYDDTNNAMTFTNARDYEMMYRFSWVGYLTKVEEEYESGLFTKTIYQYDEIGHLTSCTDAESHTTSYEYTSLFGLTKVIYPDSSYEEFHYDTMGNLVSFTDSKGDTTTYTYDSVYRLTQIQYPDTSTVSFIYDINGNRIRMNDNAPTTGNYAEYGYDTWNRLVTETRYNAQNTYTTGYGYDDVNRLTDVTYPDGTHIVYSYDDLNRITQVNQYIDGVNDEILQDNMYNTKGLITQFDFGNGLQTTFLYDSRNRPVAIDVTDGETQYLNVDYTWDSNSNITELTNEWRDTEMDWHSDTESYTYDGLDRLISATSSLWSHTYSYDKVGNRTAKDSTDYTINSVNQVTALSDGTTFDYDLNGNMIQKVKGTDTWEYTYDNANNLTKIEKNSTVLGEYVYDGDGKRIQVTENNETTMYVYSGINVLYEETSTGTACYVYGPGGRIAKITETEGESHIFYYHTDHLGSTRLVTDESQNIIVTAVYEPFGESTREGEESFLYTGKQKDSTGLYYYGARYYDPELGRFLTKDPLAGKKGAPQSLNRYTYCLNNPVKFIDPTGMFYKMCHVDGGCRWVYESRSSSDPDRPDWIAYDANGNKITDSQEMEDLRTSKNKAEQAQAVYLMLLMTHPEIQGDPNLDGELIADGYLFWVTIEGQKVPLWIYISDLFESDMGELATTKEMDYVTEEGAIPGIRLTVYQGAFQSLAHLYHVIGHEGCHVYDLITIGEDITDVELEFNGYMWNLNHAHGLFPYPWDIGILVVRIVNLFNPVHSSAVPE